MRDACARCLQPPAREKSRRRWQDTVSCGALARRCARPRSGYRHFGWVAKIASLRTGLWRKDAFMCCFRRCILGVDWGPIVHGTSRWTKRGCFYQFLRGETSFFRLICYDGFRLICSRIWFDFIGRLRTFCMFTDQFYQLCMYVYMHPSTRYRGQDIEAPVYVSWLYVITRWCALSTAPRLWPMIGTYVPFGW